MNLQNDLWMLRLVLRKKWPAVLALVAAMYLILLPYQRNLLAYFIDTEAVKDIFWEGIYMYHSIFSVTFVYQAAAQLMNSETIQLRKMWKKQTGIVLGSVFFVYQLLASPEYIWYMLVYTEETLKLFQLFLLQIISILILYISIEISKKTLIGYMVVFIGLLVMFRL